jgi:hypothetical protein
MPGTELIEIKNKEKIALKTEKGLGFKQTLKSENEIPKHNCAIEHHWYFNS